MYKDAMHVIGFVTSIFVFVFIHYIYHIAIYSLSQCLRTNLTLLNQIRTGRQISLQLHPHDDVNSEC